MNHVWLESGDYEDYVVPLSRSKTFSLCDQQNRWMGTCSAYILYGAHQIGKRVELRPTFCACAMVLFSFAQGSAYFEAAVILSASTVLVRQARSLHCSTAESSE